MNLNPEIKELSEQVKELAFIVRNLALIERSRFPNDKNWQKADAVLKTCENLHARIDALTAE